MQYGSRAPKGKLIIPSKKKIIICMKAAFLNIGRVNDYAELS
jgi:hypothetical protein